MAQHSSTPFPLVIVGSGPAGVSAARAYVDAGGPGPVLMLTSDVDHPYERPPLSKEVLRGMAAPEGTPIAGEELPDGVELRRGTTVTGADLAARTLRVGEEPVRFERLILALGAHPKPLPVADDDAEVHLLRSLDHARRLVASAGHARSAVVIGSGFIGCEAAASLALRGVATTLVTPDEVPQQKRLGREAGDRIAQWLIGAGVELRTGVRVSSIEAPRTIHLDDGVTLAPDLILAAVGIEPGGGLLEGTELTVHEGRVVADEHLAAAPGVWVAGDASRARHAVAGRPIVVEHWGDALAMGEVAGANAAVTTVSVPDAAAGQSSALAHEADADEGALRSWDQAPGFWSTIGEHLLKHSAWGDGHAAARLVERPGSFTVWYADEEDRLVGVLTYNADDDAARGRELVAAGAAWSEVSGDLRGELRTDADA
ncbi:NAD(P)/FAD-dependent oxidoreductase [Micrococcus luteus]|uniref:NAD(P)/FAD-dependent oxidoreductase n=1 Tax=Micrococcus luteus TaxID=1270 RepID=UPI0006697EDE|nr:FAD/NAD(P)-binding oxidoreductase [Micrococcus luteus]MCV7715701.1 NAD(P)/FAD-dependent oxidoreductase [Micrococcus luteus]